MRENCFLSLAIHKCGSLKGPMEGVAMTKSLKTAPRMMKSLLKEGENESFSDDLRSEAPRNLRGFPGIELLATRCGLDETISGMRSWENELVSFGRLKMMTRIDGLVTLVQDAMCKSIRSQVARATMQRGWRGRVAL